MATDLFRRLEELSMNALPALQIMTYDGWILRFAGGYTRRANSVNPLYPSTFPVEDKIRNCERWYRDQASGVVFKMTPAAQPNNLDAVLAAHGYVEESRTSVQTTSLGALPSCQGTGTVELYEEINERWLEHFCAMNQVHQENRAVLERMLQNIRARTGFMLLLQGEKVIACGLGVVEDHYMGLFDIVTDPGARGRGLGTELVVRLMQWGKDGGADTAYLQVMTSNAPALRLYAKLGFQEVYQYWYRIKKIRPAPSA